MTTNQIRDMVRSALNRDVDHLDGYVISEFLGVIKVKLLPRWRWRWRKNRAMRWKVACALEFGRPTTCRIEVL